MSKTSIEVLIIGGGPAGMSAALWCVELGWKATLVEKRSQLGGQLHWIHNPVENYLGIAAADGKEIFDRFESSLARRDFERILNFDIAALDLIDKTARDAQGTVISAEAIVLATGIRRRKLGVPGEDAFAGKGIVESGSKDARSAKGKRVAVVGGGDAAAENALMLAEYAEKVFLVHRRDKLSARDAFLDAVASNPKIEFLMNASVTEIGGKDSLEWIDVNAGSSAERLALDNLIVRIGVEPNSELVAGQVELDSRGYVTIDAACRTSAENFFAIGDVANPIAPTIASATGMAATAIKNIAKSFANLK